MLLKFNDRGLMHIMKPPVYYYFSLRISIRMLTRLIASRRPTSFAGILVILVAFKLERLEGILTVRITWIQQFVTVHDSRLG